MNDRCIVKKLVALTTVGLALLGPTIVVSAQVPAGEGFVLSGLVVLDGGDGSVWLQQPTLTKNEIVRVRRGDSVGPWRVSRILGDRVELEGPAGTVNYVILGSARAPDANQRVDVTPRQEPIAPPAGSAEEDPASQARALAHLLGTGGDEGVWDDSEASSSPAAATPVLAPPIAPGQ